MTYLKLNLPSAVPVGDPVWVVEYTVGADAVAETDADIVGVDVRTDVVSEAACVGADVVVSSVNNGTRISAATFTTCPSNVIRYE